MSINLVERIRKSAGLPSLDRGAPPKGFRGVKYWAAVWAAIQYHANEIIGELLSLRTAYSELAKHSAEQAGEIASLQQALAVKDKMLIKHGIEVQSHRMDLEPAQRDNLLECIPS